MIGCCIPVRDAVENSDDPVPGSIGGNGRRRCDRDHVDRYAGNGGLGPSLAPWLASRMVGLARARLLLWPADVLCAASGGLCTTTAITDV
jgi:hypothetical protein